MPVLLPPLSPLADLSLADLSPEHLSLEHLPAFPGILIIFALYFISFFEE